MPEVEKRLHNHTLQNEVEYQSDLPGPGVLQGPPWSTCSVEYRDGSRNVLEEWVMRGERTTVDAFRSFRKGTQGSAQVRCEETAPMASDGVSCIECVLANDPASK